MTETPSTDPERSDRRTSGLRNHAAAIIALFALAVVVAAWFWSRQQTPVDAGLGAEHGVMVIGAGTFVAALVAAIRSMSLLDVLELLWELMLGVLAAIGAVLKGIWSWFLGLLGLD
jgi:hypothetical protein